MMVSTLLPEIIWLYQNYKQSRQKLGTFSKRQVKCHCVTQLSTSFLFYWDAIQTVWQSLRLFFSVFLPLFHLRESLFPIFWIFPLKLLIEFNYSRYFCWTLFTYCNSFLHYFLLNWELDLNCGYTLSVIYYFLSVFVVISSFKDFEILKSIYFIR